MKNTGIHRFINELIFRGLESFGRYYSSYRGVVMDNNDPKNLGRVKLMIPEVTGGDTYDYWAVPKGAFSGAGYGSQVIPRPGTIVWVEFESGFIERPMYSHSYMSSDEVPQDKDLNDKNNFWFRTPEGTTVQINDTKKLINIKTGAGDYIEINPKSISLVTNNRISFGQKNKSSEPALLGDKTEEVLNEIQELLDNIVKTLTADAAASSAASQPFLMRANITKQLPTWIKSVASIKSKILKIKSKKVTLD